MPLIKIDQYEVKYTLRVPSDMHKEYVDNVVRTFAFHFIEHHNNANEWNVDRLEIMKQDQRGGLSFCLYEGSRVVNQAWNGETSKEIIQFMLGFIFDKQWKGVTQYA